MLSYGNNMNVSFINFIPILIIFIIALIVIYLLIKFVKPYEEKLKDFKYQEEYKEEDIESIIITSKIYSNFYIFVTLLVLGNIVIAFLIPWAISIKFIGFFGVWSLIFFLASILVGFIFIYLNGLQLKKRL